MCFSAASFTRLNLSRSAVTQEVANSLLPVAAGRHMQLFQIIGQDSYDLSLSPFCCLNLFFLFVATSAFLKTLPCRYEKAVKGSGKNPPVLDSLRDPPRFLIVTPREGCGSVDIQVPQAYREYVFPLNGYRDEMVCHGAPSRVHIAHIVTPSPSRAHASHNCHPLSFQVLSSTIIRGQLSSGVVPDPRALHPSVFEFIRQRGLYGCRPAATGGSESSVAAAAVAPQPSAPKPTVPNPTSARASAWGPSSKAAGALVSNGFTKAAQGGNSPPVSINSPKAAQGGSSPKGFCSPQDTAREINLELLQTPGTRRCHVVVLFGAHGTGKGTVAQALCGSQSYQHVSFGECD
jgi:hypothetical protein